MYYYTHYGSEYAPLAQVQWLKVAFAFELLDSVMFA